MTELEFYKWIKDFDPEWRWDRNGQTNKEDVIIWITVNGLESFCNLLPYSLLSEGGIEVRLQEKCIAIWASDVLNHFNIPLENIFEKE